MTAHNPFAPPLSDLSVLPKDDSPIRKPRSVWVMQILGGLFALGNAFGLGLSVYRAILLQVLSSAGTWKQFAWELCLVVALVSMLWQLPKRSRIGRNIGLGLIALLVYGAISSQRGTNSPNLSFTIGQWSGTALVVLILVYWAYAFAFSEKARHYFSDAGRG